MAYFSNGSEGMVFDDQCAKCKYGKTYCPVAFIQLTYNYDQCNNELACKIMNVLVDETGECQVWKMAQTELEIDPNQLSIEI